MSAHAINMRADDNIYLFIYPFLAFFDATLKVA